MECCETINNLLKVVKQDVFPALGCTEPVAVAYAAATSRKYIKDSVDYMLIKVSKNIYKNGKFVAIPNTNEWGLDLAGALGILGGDPEDGFMVLKNIDEDIIKLAHDLINMGKIKVEYIEESPDVYVNIIVNSSDDIVEVELKDSHTHIERIVVNGQAVYKGTTADEDNISSDFLRDMTFKNIREICEAISIEELKFIQDGVDMNKKAAHRGINEHSGLDMGYTLNKLLNNGKLSEDAPTKARILTAAAADIRMGGADCPIMTSGGSGNQGLGVVLPIIVVAEEQKIEKDKLLRAIFFGHIINRYVKIYTGKLSGMCGCSIAAGIGASAGISWMLGGNDEQISGACSNMLANLTGMICDGAKETCALKLATSASESVISSYLAREGVVIRKNVGIVGNSIEDTIRNVGTLAKESFSSVDNVIIDLIK